MDQGQGKKIVLLGVMSRLPVAGIVWQTVHYLLGFQRLGYDVYYVEAHACTPKMLMQREDDDGSARAAAFIAGTMRRFGLGGRWAFHALHADGRYYGMSEGRLKRLYRSAALIVNLHGATQPLPEHAATGRLAYLETDPGALQVELYHNVRYTLDFLEPHSAFFTFGENYGKPDCVLPVSDRFQFRPTRQPVVIDLWRPHGNGEGRAFTTIGSWRQSREITFRGEVYGWSKHQEFMRFLDLPARTNLEFELALSGCGEADWHTLETSGWSVREALALSANADAYRRYIAESCGEFTVAKDQNVRLRSGWFSDRSATYLAAGRPVVTQETGFSNVLPTGEGLFAFSDTEGAVAALEAIGADYERHRRAAAALAEEYFGHDVVLARLLADLGLLSPAAAAQRATGAVGNPDAAGVGSTPTHQEGASAARVSTDNPTRPSLHPRCSVIIPVYNNAALTRRCLDALLSGAARASFEVVVVDDASTDATQQLLAGYEERIRVVERTTNGGFATACNDGAAVASGEYLVFLNNDVLPEAGWLDALVRYAEMHPNAAAVGSKLLFPDSTVQHAGVVICQDFHPRHIYAGFPASHPAVNKSRRFRIVTAASVLLRRGPFEEIGGFDTAFRNGFEDADLCLRLGERGHEVHYCHESVCHHLEAVSEGRLDNEGENLRLYLERWSKRLQPDDLRYYVKDGLLSLDYARSYPARLAVSPVLAIMDDDEYKWQGDRLLNLRSRQVFELLKETIRLTVRVEEAELRAASAGQGDHRGRMREGEKEKDAARRELPATWQATSRPGDRSEASANGVEPAPSTEAELRAMLVEAHEQLLQRDGEIEALVHDLQANLAAVLPQEAPDSVVEVGANNRGFLLGKYFRYRQLVRRIREVAHTTLPPGAIVVVVSRGDEELLELGGGRRGWHFPQEQGGVYAGHYPADSAEAIDHLEELRSSGGEYLLFPETSLWWLEHYGRFREHLEECYQPFVREEETCLIFALGGPPETERGALVQGSNALDAHGNAPA